MFYLGAGPAARWSSGASIVMLLIVTSFAALALNHDFVCQSFNVAVLIASAWILISEVLTGMAADGSAGAGCTL